jgi:hypothetical protein
MCVNPLQHRVRKGLPIMKRKAGTASTDEKEVLRIKGRNKQNLMITTRRKNSNSGVTHPEKTSCAVYRKPKEQACEVRKTNKPAATWKVFEMVRLLTDKFSG